MDWQLVHMKAVVIVAALVLQGGVVGAQPLANIIAYWPADGNANDVVGGNDGTLEGGASFGSGKVGQAFDLTGPSDLVRMSQPIRFAQGENFTVNFWVNQAVSPPNQGFIFETRAFQSIGFAITTFQDNRIIVGGRCDNASFAYNVFSQTMISNGQWHHVAAVFDWGTAELRLYVDGCLDNTSSLSDCDGFTTSDKLFVGAISFQNDFFNFNGLVDELQVYERALTDLEIELIFAQPPSTVEEVGEALEDSATEELTDAIDEILSNPEIPDSAADSVQDALDEVIGNEGGSANNGAADKLQGGDLIAGLTKLRKAILDLQAAADNGFDTTVLQALLADFAAQAVELAIADAAAEFGEMDPGVQAAQLLFDAGVIDQDLGNFIAALDLFKMAVQVLP